MRFSRSTPLLGLGLGAALCASAHAGDLDPTEVVQDQLMVRVADPFTIDDVLALISVPGARVIDAIASRKIYLLDLPGIDEDAFEATLDAMINPTPAIPNPAQPLLDGEYGYSFGASEGQTGSIYFGVAPTLSEATFASQYAVSLLGTSTAHAIAAGAGVRVAVLDTGIDSSHALLANRIAPGGWNFLAGQSGPDFSDSANGLDDDADGMVDEMLGHGTFVSALVLLVAPEASVLPIKVLDSDGRGDSWSIVRGMYHAMDQGAHVINLSLRSSYDSHILNAACREARQLGIVVTAAAGNRGVTDGDSHDREFPAMNEIILGVGATDWLDRRAPFSNYNESATEPRIALFAPGDSAGEPELPETWFPESSIYGAIAQATGATYTVWEGTSMSSAFAAGGAALLRSSDVLRGPCLATTEWIESTLKQTAQNIDAQNPGLEGRFGAGRIDLAAALMAAPPAGIPGDLDADGQVNLNDLARLLVDFGSPTACRDVDGQPGIGLSDLAILLTNFGQ